MPGFGKSGISRIFAFKWSMQPSPDLESRPRHRRLDLVDHHLLDPRPRRAAAQRALEPFERCRVALRNRFHAAVITVGDIAAQIFAAGRVEREVAKPHALHAAAQHKAPGDHLTVAWRAAPASPW